MTLLSSLGVCLLLLAGGNLWDRSSLSKADGDDGRAFDFFCFTNTKRLPKTSETEVTVSVNHLFEFE